MPNTVQTLTTPSPNLTDLPEKTRVQRNFSRAAQQYDAAAVLQREVSDRMGERLDYIKFEPQTLLDAGSGTGYSQTKLRERYPKAQRIELDLAFEMLCTSREKQRQNTSIFDKLRRKTSNFVCADLEHLPLKSNSIDLFWSNLAIQWLHTPDNAFNEAFRVLNQGGLLMFSTLGVDTLHELRTAFRHADHAPHVNPFIDMHDLGDALIRAGFSEPVMDMEKIILTYQDLKSLMKDLKGIGAHNALNGRKRGLMGKQTWQTVQNAYETFRKDERLPTTYEVIYGHAWKTVRPSNDQKIITFHRSPIATSPPSIPHAQSASPLHANTYAPPQTSV